MMGVTVSLAVTKNQSPAGLRETQGFKTSEMQILLSKSSDVPLRQQLSEQIVFLITSGKLRPGQQMPSVRSLAQRAKIHHNTVSEAYQDLVGRGWLTRHRGKRLLVGAPAGNNANPSSLHEIINAAIVRAREMGYSLQALASCVRERLLAQPPDHVLVVEQEHGLRQIIAFEVKEKLGFPVVGCSPDCFLSNPSVAVGAQLFAPHHLIEQLKPLVPGDRPPVSLSYCGAEDHVRLVRTLVKPSVIAVISVSDSLVKTARSLLAPAIGRRHSFEKILIGSPRKINLAGIDLAFCDSLTLPLVRSGNKFLYRLVAAESLNHLAATVGMNESK